MHHCEIFIFSHVPPGDHVRQEAFQRRLRDSSCPHGVRIPSPLTMHSFTSGSAGCSQRERSPIWRVIVNFLAHLFQKGYSYSSYRSAISSVHDHIDGVAIGQHPMVTRELKGVYNQTTLQVYLEGGTGDIMAELTRHASISLLKTTLSEQG